MSELDSEKRKQVIQVAKSIVQRENISKEQALDIAVALVKKKPELAS